MDLSEETVCIEIFGIPVYAFGLCCAVGALAGLVIILLISRRTGCPKGTGILTAFLAILLGFVFGRIGFCLMNQEIGLIMPVWSWLRADCGGFSMIGVIVGGSLAALISSRLQSVKAGRMLDFVFCALLAFIAAERFGERYIADFDISRPLESTFLKGTFLYFEGEYDAYLATYYLQSIVALILLVIMLIDGNRTGWSGETSLLFLILYGASLTVLESLRYDRHLSVTFVGLQHVLAGVMMAVGVFIVATRSWKSKRGLAIASIAAMLIAAGGSIALEFAIDRTDFNRIALYVFMVVLISVPAVLAVILRGCSRKKEILGTELDV